MKKIWIICLSILTGIVLVVLLAANLLVTGERIADYVNRELGEDFVVTISEASLNPFTATLSIKNAEVKRTAGEADHLLFNAKDLEIGRIGIIAAARGDIDVGDLTLNEFYLDSKALQRGIETGSIGENTASLRIGRIKLNYGDIFFTAGGDGKGEIHNIMFEAGLFDYPSNCEDCNPLDYLQNIQAEIPGIRYSAADGYYVMTGKNITVSEDQAVVDIGTLSLEPAMSDDEFLNVLEYRTDYFRFTLSGLSFASVGFDGLRSGDELTAVSASLDSLDLHVTFDKRLPAEPDKEKVKMPAELLRDIPVRLALDTLEVHHADIYYSEYASDGERPGTILFAETDILATNMDNRSGKTAYINSRSLLEGEGTLHAEFRMPQGQDSLVAAVKGSLGDFDVTLLNNIFEDLEGLRIRDGFIHDLKFDYQMMEDRAEGIFEVRYENFTVELIDKVGHDQNILDVIGSFFFDRIGIRSASDSGGDSYTTGEISGERDEKKGFFDYLWTSLRSGIFDVVRRI
ncbi:MAG: hypothetical protein WD317_00765 [Balneolaceae bacterium]